MRYQRRSPLCQKMAAVEGRRLPLAVDRSARSSMVYWHGILSCTPADTESVVPGETTGGGFGSAHWCSMFCCSKLRLLRRPSQNLQPIYYFLLRPDATASKAAGQHFSGNEMPSSQPRTCSNNISGSDRLQRQFASGRSLMQRDMQTLGQNNVHSLHSVAMRGPTKGMHTHETRCSPAADETHVPHLVCNSASLLVCAGNHTGGWLPDSGCACHDMVAS
jgi:hypothetical protein